MPRQWTFRSPRLSAGFHTGVTSQLEQAENQLRADQRIELLTQLGVAGTQVMSRARFVLADLGLGQQRLELDLNESRDWTREWVLPCQTGELREVTVGGTHRQAVFDRQRGQMRVRHQT